MSGYRTDNANNKSASGEALLFRTLPLNVPITSYDPFSAIPPYGGSIRFKDVFFPFLDAIIVSAADGTATSVYTNKLPVAQECILSWCVKTIKSSYAWGRYEEAIVASYFNTTARHQPYPWEGTPVDTKRGFEVYTAFHSNISINSVPGNFTATDYGVSNETFARTAYLFDDMFPSSITVANSTAQPWWRVKVYAWGHNQLRPVVSLLPWLAPNNLTPYLERLATSMTNVIRSHPSHEFVQGRAYTQTTFIAVHWAWLTFPLALLLLCLVFLVATMVKTSEGYKGGVGMWKTSAMPTLIYSLPRSVQDAVSDPSTWGNNSSKEGKQVRIRLLPNQGWRVSGQACTSPTLISRSNHRIPPGWI
jgi:hypothetical protein